MLAWWEHSPIPVSTPQAVFMHRWAIFGPTPGNLHSFSTLSGMSPLYSSCRICVVFFI
jgi:hypothetical protein